MPISDMNTDDLFLGWFAYDNNKETLRQFITTCPAAKAAHDAAVAAVGTGDEKGQAVWEGFLRGLFVCAFKLGEIPAEQTDRLTNDDI